jgi:hypothetical protein
MKTLRDYINLIESNEQGVAEGSEQEGSTFKNSLHTIIRVATHLEKQMSDDENFPEWESEMIGSVKDQMVKIMDYEISKKEQQGVAEDSLNEFAPYPNLGNDLTVFRKPLAQIQQEAGVKYAFPAGFTEVQPGKEWPVDFGALTNAKRAKCKSAD